MNLLAYWINKQSAYWVVWWPMVASRVLMTVYEWRHPGVLFLDVQFSADKFTAALKKFAENDKEQMVNNSVYL